LLEHPGIPRLAGREVPADRVIALEKPLRERLVDDRTDMLDRTGNIKLVSETLGHASVETTARHLHPSKKGLAEHVN
jgi:integrase